MIKTSRFSLLQYACRLDQKGARLQLDDCGAEAPHKLKRREGSASTGKQVPLSGNHHISFKQ